MIPQIAGVGNDGKHTVDVEVVVADNLLDLSPLLEISQSLAGQATVDL